MLNVIIFIYTLTSERYKNHPMFNQRIRIRAAWIGPEEWADAGKIYTIHNINDD